MDEQRGAAGAQQEVGNQHCHRALCSALLDTHFLT